MSSNRFKGKIKGPLKKIGGNESSQEEYNKSWALLSEAFRAIHQQNAGNYTFEELYRNAYQIVLNKNADKLHAGFRQIVSEHLHNVNKIVLQKSYSKITTTEQMESSNEVVEARAGFLRQMYSVWSFHLTCMGMMSDVLRYMDKVATKDQKLPLVYDAGLAIFRDTILRSEEIATGEHMMKTILTLIEAERNGAIIDRTLLKNSLDILLSLSAYGGSEVVETVYSNDFESKFLQETRQYYEREAAKTIHELSASGYLQDVDRRLKEEDERILHYMSPETQSRLRHIVEHETISAYITTLLESGISAMLLNDQMTDLSNMHRLFSRVDPETVEFNKALTAQIVLAGDQINSSISEDQNAAVAEKINATTLALRWVQEVLDLRNKYDLILVEAFQLDQNVKNTMTRAFSLFINKNGRSAEFISLFIDENLKKGLKGKTEVEVDNVLEKTVSLFRYISDKDVFERYYKNHLAKRLLNGRSVSDDAERGMIAKLKVEVGSTFTSKMEGMFKDIKISNDTLKDFRKFETNQGTSNSIEITTSILTSTFWPVGTAENSASATCTFPPQIENRKHSFEQFYLNRHSGRQLTWLPSHGTADIRAQFGKRRYELNVSTYAMVILIQFNNIADSESLTFTDLQSMTSIPESELMRNLQSLACAKYKILSKDPKSRDVKATDKFSFNSSFTSPQLKIKIATIANKVETDTERKDTYQRIEETRKHQTEACIVRTMKARKSMDYNNLIAEVTAQLSSKFSPDTTMIKSRIEALIEREYIERDENDRKMYRYLA
ncbi:Cullin-3 [Taphrina deformans PYCC 5710]|uniref:Cullin-3 n=1 Tax=Taphrina deformans (strain PYCC 5710 / ATCC 11124 / CBS 356.35 / IMI 108563 / JCM 9778 / NBRC 8474) TaxID=1097556 RepID=R4XC56_TAPDE|nr:Cullin-3 [Taphrina deformans PYCC 5710]|eukprot:CCG83406.1 Cullin-3 [Taphrina deformans PYCC 5710]